MTRARPAAGSMPPPREAPPRLATQWLAGKCVELCGRSVDASREDHRCTLCGQRADYQRTGDPGVFGGRAYCVGGRMGALCGPFKHDKACPRHAPAVEAPRRRHTTPHEEALGESS